MKTYGNGTTEAYACDSYQRPQIGLHDLIHPDAKGRYAMDLVKSLGMSMLLDGHAGARVSTADEVAALACSVAESVFAEMARREWIVAVPSVSVMSDEARENRGKN